MNNIEDIMAMAQNVQNELAKAQDGLDKIEVEGAAGGGMVKIKASAKGRIIGVEIDESLLQPSEKQMLEDLIAAAINDAGSLVVAARSLLTALEQRPSLRLIVVGGAASLEVAPGIQAVDSGPMIIAAIQGFGLPEEYKAVMAAHRDAMNLFRTSDGTGATSAPPSSLCRASGRAGFDWAATSP